MDAIRRFLRRKPDTPPDQASTAPLDPTKLPEPFIDHVLQHLRYGSAQSIGREREKNDDSLLLITGSAESNDGIPDFGLFCVADGLGGYEHGSEASAVAVRVIGQGLTQAVLLDLLEGTSTGAGTSMEDMVTLAVQQANREVRARAEGGSTTLTCALVIGEKCTLAHVGDSRAYMITGSDIQQLTRDHSLVQELIDTGTITEEQAADHPQRNVLWNAMGKALDVKVDSATHPFPAGASLLICSDGLWGVVSDEDMRRVVTDSLSPQLACEALVKAANEAGGPDNVTVILVQQPIQDS
ncbi:MAG: protein phosphatase 2C domain-containing protein [Anaerolineales bacterium]